MSHPRLQTLRASGELREEKASDDEVSQWWRKAVAEDELRDLLTDANAELRRTRRDVEYGFEELVDIAVVDESRALVSALLNHTANHLRGSRPSIKQRIKKVR